MNFLQTQEKEIQGLQGMVHDFLDEEVRFQEEAAEETLNMVQEWSDQQSVSKFITGLDQFNAETGEKLGQMDVQAFIETFPRHISALEEEMQELKDFASNMDELDELSLA